MKVEWICVHGIAGPECERCHRARAEAERRQGDERAMRFGWLLSEIEVHARTLLDGRSTDIVADMAFIVVAADEANSIAGEVSREALDKVVGDG